VQKREHISDEPNINGRMNMKVVAGLIEAHIFRISDSGIEFLLLKRAAGEKYPNIWQMVTGTVEDDGEKAFETAIREIKEETNLAPEKFWIVPKTNSFYSHEKDEICLVPVFAVQVNPEAIVKISTEHSEFKWLSKEEAIKHLSFPGQRESVEIIYNHLINQNDHIIFVEIPLTKI
jgi:dihydroneopterin triphosphate diphosphatase